MNAARSDARKATSFATFSDLTEPAGGVYSNAIFIEARGEATVLSPAPGLYGLSVPLFRSFGHEAPIRQARLLDSLLPGPEEI
jgi:hypothetical protein